MARIAGVDVPGNKRARVGLCYIYGIGPALALRVLTRASVDTDKKVNELSEEELLRVRETISREFRVEGDLRKEIGGHVKRLIDIGSYRGNRTQRRLPLRGQRTRTNARTKRGSRQTIAGRGKRRGVAKK